MRKSKPTKPAKPITVNTKYTIPARTLSVKNVYGCMPLDEDTLHANGEWQAVGFRPPAPGDRYIVLDHHYVELCTNNKMATTPRLIVEFVAKDAKEE